MNSLRTAQFLILIFVLASCSKQEVGLKNKKSYVNIQIPHFKNGSKNKTTHHRYLASANNEGFGLTDPTTKAEIDCFAVLANWDNVGSCSNTSQAVVARASAVAGGVLQGGIISMVVPSGPARKFTLIGFKSSLATCPEFKNLSSSLKDQLSTPLKLSEVIADLTLGEQTITFNINFNLPTNRIGYCKDGPFTWTPMGIFDVAKFDQAIFLP